MSGGAFAHAFDLAFDPPALAPEPEPPGPVGPHYGDVERLLREFLSAQLDGVRVCTDLPSNLNGALPLVQVTRIGGPDDERTIDRPLVDVDAYGSTRLDAFDLADAVRDALRFALPGQIVTGTYVARVDTLSGPAWRPYDNTTLRRFGASYQLTTQKGQSP